MMNKYAKFFIGLAGLILINIFLFSAILLNFFQSLHIPFWSFIFVVIAINLVWIAFFREAGKNNFSRIGIWTIVIILALIAYLSWLVYIFSYSNLT